MDMEVRLPSFETLVEQALQTKVPYERIQGRLMDEVMGLEQVGVAIAAAQRIKKGKPATPHQASIDSAIAALGSNSGREDVDHDHGMYMCILLRQYRREFPDATLEEVLQHAATVRIETLSVFHPVLTEYPDLQREVVDYLSHDIAYGVIDPMLDSYITDRTEKVRPFCLEELGEHIHAEIFRRIPQIKD